MILNFCLNTTGGIKTDYSFMCVCVSVIQLKLKLDILINREREINHTYSAKLCQPLAIRPEQTKRLFNAIEI